MQDGIMRLSAVHTHGLWVWAPSAPSVARLKAIEAKPLFHQFFGSIVHVHGCQLGALYHKVVAAASRANRLLFGWRDFWVGSLTVGSLALWLGRSVGLWLGVLNIFALFQSCDPCRCVAALR